MAKGIIYVMTCVVSGLIKIGKTATPNFEQRMYSLEHDGYRNVTGFKRQFAIEVEKYDEKEALIHKIFDKSRVSDTELFAVPLKDVIDLLSAFEGNQIYPKKEVKEAVKENIIIKSKQKENWKTIPDGTYYIRRFKKSDNREINIKATVVDGNWTILKGSVLGVFENVAVPYNVRNARLKLKLGNNGELLSDAELGRCSPSFASSLAINSSSSGWDDWKKADGESIFAFRKSNFNKPNSSQNNNALGISEKRFLYWSAFNDYASKNNNFKKMFSLRKPTGGMYYDFAIGSSVCHLLLAQKRNRSALYIALYTKDKVFYNRLFNDKKTIESNFDFKLNWEQSAERKSCAIGYEKSVNYDDKNSWNQQFDWVMETLLKMKIVFSKYIG